MNFSELLYLFARFIEPFEIIACWKNGSCFELATSSSQLFFSTLKQENNYNDFHLATNAIRVSESPYCAIFHALRLPAEFSIAGRFYAAYVYFFQAKPSYAIEYVSHTPLQLSKVGLIPQLQDALVRISSLTWVDGRIAFACMHGYSGYQQTGVYFKIYLTAGTSRRHETDR